MAYTINIRGNTEKIRSEVKRLGTDVNRVANKNFRNLTKQIDRGGAAAVRLGNAIKGGLIASLSVAALKQGITALKNMSAEMDTLAKTARALNFPIEDFQLWRVTARQAGVDTNKFNDSLATFTERINDAANGAGAGKEVFDQYGISVRDASGNIKSTNTLLDELSDAWHGNANATQTAGEAVKLFGAEGVGFVNFLKQGSERLAEMRDRARELGVVIDEQLFDRAEAATDQIGLMSDVINAQLKTALIDILPFIVKLVEGLASAVRLIRDFKDASDAITTPDEASGTSTQGLETRLATLRQRAEERERFGGLASGSQLGGFGAQDVDDEINRIQRELLNRRAAENQRQQQAGATTPTTRTRTDDDIDFLDPDAIRGTRSTGAARATGTSPFADAGVGSAGGSGIGDALKEVVEDSAQSNQEIAETYFKNLEDGFTNAIKTGDLGALADSFKDSLVDTLTSASEAGFNSLAQNLAKLAVDALKNVAGTFFRSGGGGFAKGGIVKAATGGIIRGPGTGTSDSIPALLSNGEYVVRASQVAGNRAALDAINGGRGVGSTQQTFNVNLVGDITEQVRAGVSNLIPVIVSQGDQLRRENGGSI